MALGLGRSSLASAATLGAGRHVFSASCVIKAALGALGSKPTAALSPCTAYMAGMCRPGHVLARSGMVVLPTLRCALALRLAFNSRACRAPPWLEEARRLEAIRGRLPQTLLSSGSAPLAEWAADPPNHFSTAETLPLHFRCSAS
jgi:hypothetical protein